jgi:hypothetical protein
MKRDHSDDLRSRWEVGIGLDLWDICWGACAQDEDRWRAFVNAVMKLWVLAPWS